MLSRTVQMKGPKSIQSVTSAILERDIYIERERELCVHTHTRKGYQLVLVFSTGKKIQDALKRGHPVLPELKIGKP